MRSSIIICTRNGSRTIARAIRSVAAQTDLLPDEIELIVVDNGSNDGTPSIVEEAFDAVPFPHRLDSVPAEGKLKALLYGLSVARADLVTVLDDDNVIDARFLRHSIDFIDSHPLVGMVGSTNRVAGTEVPSWFHGIASYYGCGAPYFFEGGKNVGAHRTIGRRALVAGAGSTFRRDILVDALEAGFFFLNDAFRGTRISVSGEDSELCALFHSMGWYFGHDRRLTLEHHIDPARITLPYARKLCRSIGAGLEAIDLLDAQAGKRLDSFKMEWWWRLGRRTKRLAGHAMRRLSHQISCKADPDWAALHVETGALVRCLKEGRELTRLARLRSRSPWMDACAYTGPIPSQEPCTEAGTT